METRKRRRRESQSGSTNDRRSVRRGRDVLPVHSGGTVDAAEVASYPVRARKRTTNVQHTASYHLLEEELNSLDAEGLSSVSRPCRMHHSGTSLSRGDGATKELRKLLFCDLGMEISHNGYNI